MREVRAPGELDLLPLRQQARRARGPARAPFEELHALFPSPSAFDDLPPLERLEAWFSAACKSLDERPDYLLLLVAIGVGPQREAEAVQGTVRRLRDYAHASWVNALTPVFAPDGAKADKALVEELAVLGRALTDGLSVANAFDGISYSSEVASFVALVRGLARHRDSARRVTAY